MKTSFYTKTMLALMVAIAATVGLIGYAQDQPQPAAADDSALPAGIEPNTPLAQVVKLAQAGVDVTVIRNYISNSPGAFNLDADKIILVTDVGVPKDVVNAMLDRDKALYLANVSPPPSATTETAPPPTDTAPPTAPVTVNYFNDTLSPYGSWVVVEGYGRCWRPTTVIYDAGWRPYCDRGHWVYTDCGWYWDSDYSWGVTFHYGRWFRHDRFGWCWYPDTEWAPSWVTWRSSSDYCGWAPLPPLAVYRPGAGFFYRGASVSVGFDFGLRPDCYTFVPPDHFCEHHPRRFCVEPARSTQVFAHTAVVNNFEVRDRFVVNRGIDASRFTDRNHHAIEAVKVGSLPNAGRQGWRGGEDRPDHHAGDNNKGTTRTFVNGGGNGHVNGGPVVHDGRNNEVDHHPDAGGQQNVNHGAGSPYVTPRHLATDNQNGGNQNNKDGSTHNDLGNHNGQHNQGVAGGNAVPASTTPATGPAHGNNNNNRHDGGNSIGVRTSHGTGTWDGGNGQHSSAGSAAAGGTVLTGQHPVAAPAVGAPVPNQVQNAGNNSHGNGAAVVAHPDTGMAAPRFQQQQSEQQSRQHEQQINAAMAAARTSPGEQWSRAQHAQPQPPVMPSAPAMEQHNEMRQPKVGAAPHSAPPAAAPVQVQNQPHDSQSHDSNRGAGNDKRDH